MKGRGRRPFKHLERPARALAGELGLYVLFGCERNPGWSVFSIRSGKWILNYWPKTRFWTAGKERGMCSGYRDALHLALTRCGKQNEGLGAGFGTPMASPIFPRR